MDKSLSAGIALLAAGILACPEMAGAAPLVLGFEDQAQWERWQEITFPDKEPTRYEYDPGTQTVCAEAVAAVSALAHEFPGELEDFPVLSWEWRIDQVLEKGDARSREGDDYAGRVYVNFTEGDLGWWDRAKLRTLELFYGRELPRQVLSFIWANVLEEGEIVESPFTEHARLVALRSGNRQAGEWVREEVDIREEYRRAFGGEPPPVHSIAIMTDGDNTGETARGCYRNITLSR